MENIMTTIAMSESFLHKPASQLVTASIGAAIAIVIGTLLGMFVVSRIYALSAKAIANNPVKVKDKSGKNKVKKDKSKKNKAKKNDEVKQDDVA